MPARAVPRSMRLEGSGTTISEIRSLVTELPGDGKSPSLSTATLRFIGAVATGKFVVAAVVRADVNVSTVSRSVAAASCPSALCGTDAGSSVNGRRRAAAKRTACGAARGAPLLPSGERSIARDYALAGLMFWFTLKTLSGSYCRLIEANRA